MAMGIASVGGRLGQVVFAPLCAFLIARFGWRMAYMVTGLISWLVLIPASRLMRNDPREIGTLPEGVKLEAGPPWESGKEGGFKLTGFSITQAIKMTNYWVLVPVWLFMGFSNLLAFTHVVPYATDVNVTAMAAATILSVIGGSAMPAGILAGRISDIAGRKIPLIIASLLRVVALLGLIWARELWAFYLFAVVFGISISSIGVILAALSVDIFGKRSIGVILATLDMSYAVGATIGPFIGGLVYDVYNSYNLSFFIAAAGSLLSVILIILIKMEAKAEPV